VEPDLESHGVIDNSKSIEIEIGWNSNMHAHIRKVPIPIDGIHVSIWGWWSCWQISKCS